MQKSRISRRQEAKRIRKGIWLKLAFAGRVLSISPKSYLSGYKSLPTHNQQVSSNKPRTFLTGPCEDEYRAHKNVRPVGDLFLRFYLSPCFTPSSSTV
jgi:hypothetical protein